MLHLLVMEMVLAALPQWEPSAVDLAQRVGAVCAWMNALETDVHEAKLRRGTTAPRWIQRKEAWKEGDPAVHFGVGSWTPEATSKGVGQDVRLAEFLAASHIRGNGGGEAVLVDWYVEPSGRIWALGASGPVLESLHVGMRAPREARGIGRSGIGRSGIGPVSTWSSDDEQRAWEAEKRRQQAYSAKGLNVGFGIEEGYIPEEVIDRIIRDNLEGVRACRKTAGLGKVVMKWVISARGSVAKVQLQQGEAPPAVVSCLAAEIKRWVFPVPNRVGVVLVEHSFEL